MALNLAKLPCRSQDYKPPSKVAFMPTDNRLKVWEKELEDRRFLKGATWLLKL